MTSNIIIPIIVIIICFIIVYGIINYKFNKRIINTIESFRTNLEIRELNNFTDGLYNNLKMTSEIANGSWTTLQSEVDTNYIIKGAIIEINVNTQFNNKLNNYGSIKIINNNSTEAIINIKSILNGIIVCNGFTVSNEYNSTINIIIEFIGLADVEKKRKIENEVYYVNNTQVAIISIFMGSTLLTKFASYKIYNNKVDSDVFKILISKSFFINNPPEVYDYRAYNTIINSYTFPSNLISFKFSNINNSTILNKIRNNYLGVIVFAVQRVFNSPTGNKIKTKLSNSLTVNAINNSSIIPDSIEILPVSEDKKANNLNSFFKPVSTIVYFYKFRNISDVKYQYNGDPRIVSSSVMNYNNNSSSMFNPSIKYDILSSVYKSNLYTYDIQYLTTVMSEMDKSATINFSSLSQLL